MKQETSRLAGYLTNQAAMLAIITMACFASVISTQSRVTGDSEETSVTQNNVQSGTYTITVSPASNGEHSTSFVHKGTSTSACDNSSSDVVPERTGSFVRLDLTTKAITDCITKKSEVRVTANAGVVSFDFRPELAEHRVPINVCPIVLTVDPGHLIFLRVMEEKPSCSWAGNFWEMRDTVSGRVLNYYTGCGPLSLYSLSNTMTVVLTVKEGFIDDAHFLAFNFTAQRREQGVIKFTSPVRGYVQSPHCCHKQLSRAADTWIRLIVPGELSVMTSFTYFLFHDRDPLPLNSSKCRHNGLEFYKGGNTALHRIWAACGMVPPSTAVHVTPVLYWHFIAAFAIKPHPGFNLSFSFHNHTSVPQQLPGGQWNCSVPYWDDFRHHFPCDLVAQCVDNEDEAACPYSSRQCGPGFLEGGGGCHFLILPDYSRSSSTWREAANWCLERGAQISSFSGYKSRGSNQISF
ncbi:hypothetical protein BaRGS_00019963 [Batillaria attramentaria]|uniref:C-type lectin domain-containing protein n=1 Tax=Batillaria attramentaria TaxID=370345 RepID=A0ABD0KNL5_9CAEN